MKALNRAIARTVSQLGRYGREGCHPPMLMALENHLDALLTMERKQLQVAGMKFATLTGDGPGEALPVINITNTGCADGKAVAAHILRELECPKTPDGIVAFSTPQEKNGSLFDRFVANGMMEDDGFHDSGEARKLGITPARILAQMHQNDGSQMAALEKACEAASNYAREGAQYLQQRDEAVAALKDTLDSLEYVEKHMPGMNGFMVRQERIARARTVIAKIKGSAASDKPVQWYQHGVWSAFDPNLQQTPSAASEQPVPPMPDVIDMTDSRNWQVGDVLRCSDSNAFLGFNDGDECAVAGKSETYVTVRRNSGTAVTLHHDKTPASNFFTWLRHGESQQ